MVSPSSQGSNRRTMQRSASLRPRSGRPARPKSNGMGASSMEGNSRSTCPTISSFSDASMVQVLHVMVPPGFSRATASDANLRWYSACFERSRRVLMSTLSFGRRPRALQGGSRRIRSNDSGWNAFTSRRPSFLVADALSIISLGLLHGLPSLTTHLVELSARGTTHVAPTVLNFSLANTTFPLDLSHATTRPSFLMRLAT
mmetsp:Transcript_36222/g.108539  ORF Transcript_36222/g.108539 Transcript_36222/m.108539 type:complete len:201 (-) Transcript_36222:1287-1889(-)